MLPAPVAVTLGSLGVFRAVAAAVTSDVAIVAEPDVAAVDGLHQFALHRQAWVQVMGAISFVGSAAVYLPLTTVVVLLLLWPHAGRGARLALVAGAAVLISAIGFSRVALGVHYPSDVLAGYALGAAWVTICWAFVRRWERASPGSS